MPNSCSNFRVTKLVTVTILVLSLSILLIVANSQQQEEDESNSDARPSSSKELRASEALESIRNWALRFGREVYYGTQEASCFRVLHDQFDPGKSDPPRRGPYKASVISNDWTSMHADIVRTISNTMSWHKSAVESIARASEGLAKNHSYDANLRFDYVDVHRLYDLNDLTGSHDQLDGNGPADPSSNDYPASEEGATRGGESSPDQAHTESAELDSNGQSVFTEQPEQLGTPAALLQSERNITLDTTSSSSSSSQQAQDVEWQTPIKFLDLKRHPNFGDVPISTEESAVHVPVHIFPGDPPVMNGIAWSDSLTKVFRDNFVRNPKLTNQYFASQSGFMRLFPAQRWQIPRTDPDLYDARMRPWYVAGASSRKEVVILVDASGSMTGSRRDIAKGVVFEILDTLTDNDNFLILKFSDSVQQVGVPSCERMRLKRRPGANIPLKNQLYHPDDAASTLTETTSASPQAGAAGGGDEKQKKNGTDVDSLYFLPANGRNVRYVKTNFTIPTSGIANFSHALVTAFEVLLKYQDIKQLGALCNQAIMLITDGSPSDFEEIFNRYNYPNAPVRVFTYLIGRETGDGTHTKMMACRNRGYYTHVINLAEVRETVQQYVPVMARPLVLNRAHPITWTPAYGELTYQMLTDWIWESRRRERARTILAINHRGQYLDRHPSSGSITPEISVVNTDESHGTGSTLMEAVGQDDAAAGGSEFSIGGDALEQELDAIDIFGYNTNPDCFWETTRNDLLTTVVQPVHDLKNDTKVVERFLNKNTWVTREMVVRTANLLGVAAADMKINDIIALAPSHKLGPNGYAIMLTNNGLVMHHPDLRSILEPGLNQISYPPTANVPYSQQLRKLDQSMRVLKPFFSSLDFTQVEHILQQTADADFVKLRKEAVEGLTGWRELATKRTLDCQRRVQSRKQSFYYRPLEQFPFSFMIAIPQPYGSHRLEAQVDVKSAPSTLPEKLTTYFTTSDFDIWTVHPEYEYCAGPSNNTITTLLDMFQRIQEQKLDDIQARPAESSRPPVSLPGKIVYDKELVQSLVYDAVATYGFSDSCSLPNPSGDGLTRVRHFVDDIVIKKEALAFARHHSRGSDETFYKRTVDYNMLINETATLIQVPFNMHQKILARLLLHGSERTDPASVDASHSTMDSLSPAIRQMDLFEKLQLLANASLHAIATQSVIVNEGNQRAVAGVVGVFYDYAQFFLRFLNTTNSNFQQSDSWTSSSGLPTKIKCGYLNDSIDCLLVDNNGYIIVSEELDFVGRHLSVYDPVIMGRLVAAGVFHEVNVTDYQSICLDEGEKQASASSGSHLAPLAFIENLYSILSYSWAVLPAVGGLFFETAAALMLEAGSGKQDSSLPKNIPISTLIPNKTYLRPCEKILTRHETRPGVFNSDAPEYYSTKCNCPAWFVYEQVAQTNLILILVDTTRACRYKCDLADQQRQQQETGQFRIIGHSESHVCSMIERETKLHKRTLDSCYAHHPDEEHISLCGSADASVRHLSVILILFLLSISFLHIIKQ